MYRQQELTLTPEEILYYLRKSQSDDDSLTTEEVLERHERDLDEFCEKQFGGVPSESNRHREVVSGETIEKRGEFLQVLKRIESPKVRAVLVKECSRLGRPDLEEIGKISKLFRLTNTLIITPQRTFDLRDEWDREAFEREMMKSNDYLNYYKKILRAGRERSCADGWFVGNKSPYGYDRVMVMDGKRKRYTLKFNDAEVDVVRMIFDMYVNQDMGRVNIAHRLNDLGIPTRSGALWGQNSIKNILENEHYIGKTFWNKRRENTIVEDGEIRKIRPVAKSGDYLLYDGRHPAIISDELFRAARDKQGKNHKSKAKTKVRNPLAGLLFCQCGRAMSLRTYKYHDGAPRLLCDNQTYCKTTSCLYSEILDRVRDVLKQCIEDFEVRIENDDKDSRKLHDNLIKRLNTKLEGLNKKELNQWEKYSEEEMPKEIFDKLNEKVLKEKTEIQEALRKARESMPEPIDYEKKLRRFKDALEALDDPEVPAEKQNRLLKACIERIDYKREKAERIKSQQVRYYDKERKQTRYKSPLGTGGNWTNPPIELDIKLRLREE